MKSFFYSLKELICKSALTKALTVVIIAGIVAAIAIPIAVNINKKESSTTLTQSESETKAKDKDSISYIIKGTLTDDGTKQVIVAADATYEIENGVLYKLDENGKRVKLTDNLKNVTLYDEKDTALALVDDKFVKQEEETTIKPTEEQTEAPTEEVIVPDAQDYVIESDEGTVSEEEPAPVNNNVKTGARGYNADGVYTIDGIPQPVISDKYWVWYRQEEAKLPEDWHVTTSPPECAPLHPEYFNYFTDIGANDCYEWYDNYIVTGILNLDDY